MYGVPYIVTRVAYAPHTSKAELPLPLSDTPVLPPTGPGGVLFMGRSPQPRRPTTPLLVVVNPTSRVGPLVGRSPQPRRPTSTLLVGPHWVNPSRRVNPLVDRSPPPYRPSSPLRHADFRADFRAKSLAYSRAGSRASAGFAPKVDFAPNVDYVPKLGFAPKVGFAPNAEPTATDDDDKPTAGPTATKG